MLLGVLIAVGLLSQLATSTRLLSVDEEFAPFATDIASYQTTINAGVGENPAEGKNPTSDKRTEPGKRPSAPVPKKAEKIKYLLDEGFDGTALDSTLWNTCHWWGQKGCTIASNDELEWYTPDQVKVADGALHLTAKERTVYGSDGKKYDYASAMVTTGPPRYGAPAKLAFTYGKVEVRFKIPAGKGLWPAIWLLPASTESVPEIDMLEVLGDTSDILRMHFHAEDPSADSQGEHYTVPGGHSLADGWHTIGMDWTPGRLVFWLDGKKVWDLKDSNVPDEPMYLVMNLAVGGNYPGSPDNSTQFPATFLIDRVRIQGDG